MSIETVNTRLAIEGLEEISESTYEDIIQKKILELESIIGVDLNPRNRKQYTHKFKGEIYQLNFYPVQKISSIKINNTPLEDYFLNEESGIIYLDHTIYGKVLVNYTTCISQDEFEHYFKGLLTDMVIYQILSDESDVDGVVSSLREGDVSVGYDVSNSLGNRIWTRISELKDKYSTRIQVI